MFRSHTPAPSRRLAAASVVLLLCAAAAHAQTTSFTYQGRLTDAGAPANGPYDFEFRLFDAAGVQVGAPLLREDVQVTNGTFTVVLDFGAPAFTGEARLIEIGVRPGASVDPFTTLSPRQTVTSAPYAVRTLSAASADSAQTTADAQRLGGLDAAQYVRADDARLSDARAPLAGSAAYIQNGTAQQAASFHISGDGAAAGTLTGGVVSATTEFRIGSNRVLKATGQYTSVGVGAGAPAGILGNSFFGSSAGASAAAGGNSFFGSSAGKATVDGDGNSFFGSGAGLRNTAGKSNNFFGASAGLNNTTGNFNTFVGWRAGSSNTTEALNTYVGHLANGAAGVTNATAIGANASVTQSNSLVLGSAAVSVGVGTTAPKARLHVANGSVYLSGAGKGIILKSPDGLVCRALTIGNDGRILVLSAPCL